jgi:hypothetical protein
MAMIPAATNGQWFAHNNQTFRTFDWVIERIGYINKLLAN